MCCARKFASGPAVSNCLPECDSASREVVVYPQGSGSYETLMSPGRYQFYGIALDADDDLYAKVPYNVWQYHASASGYQPKQKLLAGISAAGWLGLDAAGHILVAQTGSPYNGGVGVYSRRATTPSYVIGLSPRGTLNAAAFALDATESFLYVHAYENGWGCFIFRYPSGTPYAVYQDTLGETPGLFAIDPPEPPPPLEPTSRSRRPTRLLAAPSRRS